MRKTKRILAFLLVAVIVATTVEVPVNAVVVDVPGDNNFKPVQPIVSTSEEQMQIEGVDVLENQVEIHAYQSMNEFILVLELLTDGGVHLYDKADCNGIFQESVNSLRDEITVTRETGRVCVTGVTSGVRVMLKYEDAGAWEMQIYKKDSDAADYVISADELLVEYEENKRTNVSFQGEIVSGEQFVGLGERFTGTILNGKVYPMWNEDCWSAGLSGDKTTSYANVPLLHSSNGYSVFFNSFYSGNADIGSINEDRYQLDFAGPDLDVFLWTGTPLQNVKSYASVTGTTVAIPKWAIGYWAGGNTNNYWNSLAQKYYDEDTEKVDTATVADYYDEALKEILQNYKTIGTMPKAIFGESIPTRAIEAVSSVSSEFGVELLGWYHPDTSWDADQYRLINANVLTTLKGFLATDKLPLIKTTSDEYYTYTNDGGKTEWNRVDYTHLNVGKLLTANLTRGWNNDLSGLMVDYGEYIKSDWVFANGMTGAEMHNLQAYYYNKAMKEAWDQSTKASDYVLFARAGSAGSQSYAAQFGGDQKCNFEGLRQAVMGGLSASASGFGIWGSDIGGLGVGTTESANNPLLTAELYMRWLGFGTFSTLMRTHGTQDHDPWTFADEVQAEGLGVNVEEVFQKYYWTRENLTDAIYSATLQSNKDGTPVMQVMGLAYPEHFSVGDQYLFCNEMLVAPIYEEGNTSINGTVSKPITFPKGRWYDLWSGEIVEGDGSAITVDVPVDDIPVYLKSGSVMPIELSTKTYDLADSMDKETSVQALLVTPAEEGETRTSTWYIGEDANAPAFTYTSQMAEGIYSIRAEQTKGNPTVLCGYGIEPWAVCVDGEKIERIYHKPIGQETGLYIHEGTKEMVLSLPDGNWETITFGDYKEVNSVSVDFDHIDVATLNNQGFTSTQISTSSSSVVGTENQAVENHWFSGNGEGTPYVTRKGETGVNIWYSNPNTGLKPITAGKDNIVTLLNTPCTCENFTMSMEVCFGYLNGIVLGPANVYPSSGDSNGIRIYFANGRVQILGAVDNSNAKVSDGTSFSTSGNTGLFLAQNTLSSNKYYTINVKKENNILTIWIDGYDIVLSIPVAEHFEAGKIALMARKFDEDGGGIQSLEIKKLEQTEITFDDIDLSNLDAKGFTSTQFDKDNSYAIVGQENQSVSAHWYTGEAITVNEETFTSGNIGIKPIAKDSSRRAQLLNTPYLYKDFKLSMDIYWGVNCGVVFGKENVYPRNINDYAAASVCFANNRIQLGGAIDYSTAKVEGTGASWTTYATNTGIFYFTSGFTATKNAVYTLNVEKADHLLTIWVDGYPGVLTVELAEHYETGAIALMAHKHDGDGGGIKSVTIDEIRTRYEEYTPTEFATYREESTYKAPTKEGYLFAGWFKDEMGSQHIGASTQVVEQSVYAKFVPKNILSVKAQVSSNLLDDDTTNDRGGNIRFVTTADTLKYQQIGFYISYDKGNGEKTMTSASNEVYKWLYAVGSGKTQRISYQPSDICGSSTYFKACTVRNIDQSYFDTEFTVTAFWKTLDGTLVKGETVVKTVQQGIEATK